MLSIDNTTFNKFLPNVFATVEGESTLYEKCEDFLEQGKDLLEQYFIGVDYLPAETATSSSQVEGAEESEAEENVYADCLSYAQRLVCIHAVILAIPSIDLVLTPNGFGVVNSSDVVPASADRVERLISMLVKQKNDIMRMLQYKLLLVPAWQETRWFKFWKETMFGDISSLHALDGSKDMDLIDFLLIAKPKILTIEKKLSDCFFGKEIIDVLRKSALLGYNDSNTERVYLANCLVAEIVKMYNGNIGQFYAFPFIDYIRKHKSSFPEWEASEFGQYYEAPDYYENKKENGGFWFS